MMCYINPHTLLYFFYFKEKGMMQTKALADV